MKKSHFSPLVVGLAILAVSMPLWAGDVISADRIAKVLTTRTKAVVGPDGKVTQSDPALDLQIAFDFRQITLKPDGKLQLDQLALAFAKPDLTHSRFEIAGHTDMVGAYDYNIKLSEARANAVRDYLNRQHGIALDRMVTQGYGYTRLADERNPKSAANRRVEIRHLLQQNNPAPAVPAVPAASPQGAPVGGGELIQRPQ